MFRKIFQSKGSAILIVLALIAMLTSIAIMSVDRSNTDLELSFNQMNEEQAFYVAEAGLELAVLELKKDLDWRTGFNDKKLGNGIFDVVVVDSSDNPALIDTVILRSTANVSGSNVNLEAWMVPARYRPFQFALFSDFWLRMTGGCTDSYNSDSGSYAETQSDSGASIGTNGDLWLRDSASVGGDVFVGNLGTYDIDSTANIAGKLITDQPPLDMPAVPAAEFADAKANNAAPAGFSGSGYTYSKDNLTILTNDSLVLSSGVYYFNDITIRSNGKLKIAPGASVTIYMNQHIAVEDYGTMNAGGKPSDLIIYASPASRLRIDDFAEFRGAYWGPGATFRMRNSSQAFGSINIERETIDLVDPNAPCFHYDRALANYGMKSILKGFEKIAWRQN